MSGQLFYSTNDPLLIHLPWPLWLIDPLHPPLNIASGNNGNKVLLSLAQTQFWSKQINYVSRGRSCLPLLLLVNQNGKDHLVWLNKCWHWSRIWEELPWWLSHQKFGNFLPSLCPHWGLFNHIWSLLVISSESIGRSESYYAKIW